MPVDDESGSNVSFGSDGRVEIGGRVAVDLVMPAGGGGEWRERLLEGLVSGLFLLTSVPGLLLVGDLTGDCWSFEEPLRLPKEPFPPKLNLRAKLLRLLPSRSSPAVLPDVGDCVHRSTMPSAMEERRFEVGLVWLRLTYSSAASSMRSSQSGRYGAVDGRGGMVLVGAVCIGGGRLPVVLRLGSETRKLVEAELNEEFEREREWRRRVFVEVPWLGSEGC